MIWNYIGNKSVIVLKKINALEFQRGVFLRIKRKQLFGSVKKNTWRFLKKNLEHIFNSDIIDKKLKILMLTLKWAYLEINCTAEVSFYSYFPLVMINRSYMLILRRRNLILEWIHHVMSLQKINMIFEWKAEFENRFVQFFNISNYLFQIKECLNFNYNSSKWVNNTTETQILIHNKDFG